MALGAIVLAAPAWAGIEVEILYPDGTEAVFDRITVQVGVVADEDLAEVSLWLDGRRVGKLSPPAWELEVDVGGENRSHRFEVRAVGDSGTEVRMETVTPAIHVDEDVSVQLQQIFVTVTDRRGQRVLDLGRGDLVLRDNKIRQEIVTLGTGDIPFTAVLLLDASLSMEGRQLKAVIRGARAFAGAMVTHDEVKVMVFADRLMASIPFTSDPEAMVEGLPQGRASGGTALFDHLFWAVRQTQQRLGRRVVVFLSDGADVHSVLSMDQVREAVRETQTTLYWIELTKVPGTPIQGLHHSFRVERQVKLLRRTTEESGGRVLRAYFPREIEEALEEVIRELREQVAIGYYPQPPSDDGQWHEVEVKVRKPGLKTRARTGYFAADGAF